MQEQHPPERVVLMLDCPSCGDRHPWDGTTAPRSAERVPCGFCYHCVEDDATVEVVDEEGREQTCCEQCEEERVVGSCDWCSQLTERLVSVINGSRRRTTSDVCHACYMDTSICDGCGDPVADQWVVWDGRADTHYCPQCHDEEFSYCAICDEHIHQDDYDHDCTVERPIHEYGSIPDGGWRLRGIPETVRVGRIVSRLPFFGVEIEVESNDDNSSDAQWTTEQLENWNGGVWTTHDGSLYNGFEITTHPLTIEVWRNSAPELSTVLRGLARRGVRAWDKNRGGHSVGIHCHVSRDGFTSDAHLVRFCFLFQALRASWERAAGRTSSYARFDGLKNIPRKAKGYASSEHGDAVNIGRRTVEVRIFRSSLVGERVLGDVELCAAAVEFTRAGLSVEVIKDPARLAVEFGAYLLAHYPAAAKVWSGERFNLEQSREDTNY